jgi:hypothetical protein
MRIYRSFISRISHDWKKFTRISMFFSTQDSIIWTNIFFFTSVDRDIACLVIPLAASSKKMNVLMTFYFPESCGRAIQLYTPSNKLPSLSDMIMIKRNGRNQFILMHRRLNLNWQYLNQTQIIQLLFVYWIQLIMLNKRFEKRQINDI